MREILVLPIRLYQLVGSPIKNALLGSAARCRFEPTCSTFAIEAIRRFGCFYGSWLALCRLCRCHPWGGCGEDPVPGIGSKTQVSDSASEARPVDKNRFQLLISPITFPLF
ncbi:MAG: membrane protein insertion efficiency factor YidD [Verrucomicrobia bacterium]|nr:membrane protein insertion efficiency factor YidD [Verrucomicrobiota bacterium]